METENRETFITYLLVGRKDGETGSSWLVLVWSAESPESNRAATKLSEPALKLGLGGVVRETGHVEDLAALGKESSDIGTGIHWSGKNIRVLMSWLGLGNKATKDTG